MPDYYDHRGRLLDGPDDPGEAACGPHRNSRDTCQECLEDFKREEVDYLAWRATQPAPLTEIPDDLPF